MLTPIRSLLFTGLALVVAAENLAAQSQVRAVPPQREPVVLKPRQPGPNPARAPSESPERIRRLPATGQPTTGRPDAGVPTSQTPRQLATVQETRGGVVPAAGQQSAKATTGGVVRAGGATAGAIGPAQHPHDPFRLTAEQQAKVDQVLKLWETESAKISTYKCSFVRWEYSSVFLNNETPLSVSKGSISYVKPDKGSFKVTEIKRYNSQTNKHEVQDGDPNEHWVCTGDAVYEFDEPNKQLKKYEIPPEQQGKAIADGPLPFVFGAEAEKLKRRYWIRISPESEPAQPKNQQASEDIWLDVVPKHQADATNYSGVQVVLNCRDFLPKAMRIIAPSGNEQTRYAFSDAKVNSFLDQVTMFRTPTKPFGWKLIVEKAPTQGAAAENGTTRPQPNTPAQATRNSSSTRLPR